MTASAHPAKKRGHLRHAQIDGLFGIEVERVESFQGNGIVRKSIDGKARDLRFHVGTILLEVRKGGATAKIARQGTDNGALPGNGGGLDHALLGFSAAAGESAIPLAGSKAAARGKHGNDNALARVGGELDGDFADLILAKLATPNFDHGVKGRTIVIDLANDRKPACFVDLAFVPDMQIKLQGGARWKRKTREQQKQQQRCAGPSHLSDRIGSKRERVRKQQEMAALKTDTRGKEASSESGRQTMFRCTTV